MRLYISFCQAIIVIALGGDNVSFLGSMSDEDLTEITESLSMSDKPLHVARFVKVLSEWQSNPQSFTAEIDNFDLQPENNIKIKKNAARGWNTRQKS